MKRLYRFLGSLPMAVILLVLLGTALGLGTWCETKYGTPAAQHFFYRAPWFQGLLAFLCLNLVLSALRRYPWKKHQIGFAMTHLGIILLLTGNLIGIWFSVEGSLIIPEGETVDQLELPREVLWVRSENPGTPFVFPLDFSMRPWVHDVRRRFSVDLEGEPLRLTVDRYFPNTVIEENVIAGERIFPALALELQAHRQAPQEVWLFSRDPERFGFRWGEAHVLFFEVENASALESLLKSAAPPADPDDKGTLQLTFPDLGVTREIAVDPSLGKTFPIEGTPYTVSLKEYFPDFIITDDGPATRSPHPENPALAFTLEGPEGKDAFLVFAMHPEFEERHGLRRTISARAIYVASTPPPGLPPGLAGIVRSPEEMKVVMTSPDGEEKEILPFSLNETYTHPWLDLSFRVLNYLPKARPVHTFRLKDNEVARQAIHVVMEKGDEKKEEWFVRGGKGHFAFGDKIVLLSYQPATRKLPFSVELLDFRKTEYPGTSVAAAFASDVAVSDPERGLRLLRTISMNRPLTYRGYTMFQSSFIEGPTETTILSVRKDPATPVVYAGFITILLGVMMMFYFRKPAARKETGK